MTKLLSELALDKMRLFEDGTPILIARPKHPKRAIELSKLAVGKGEEAWQELQSKVNAECGPYTFVGYLGKALPPPRSRRLWKHHRRVAKHTIVDDHGSPIGELEPGDSFVHYKFWEAAETPSEGAST